MERENLLEPVLGDGLSQRDLIGDLLCLHFVAADQHGAVPQRLLKSPSELVSVDFGPLHYSVVVCVPK